MSNNTKLSEVDKLLTKVNSILTALGKGPDAENSNYNILITNIIGVDLTQIKDEFEVQKYQINQKLAEVETFLNKKDELKPNNPRDVMEKTQLNIKIEDGLREVEQSLDLINRVLRAQKKNSKKYGDVSHKEQAKNLIEERYTLLKNKQEGIAVDEKKIADNKNTMERLEALLVERNQNNYQDREMNEHEVAALDRWNKEVADQDIQLQELQKGVKELKGHTKNITGNIDAMGRQIKKTTDNAKKTENKLETTNAKLKNLLGKIRSGDRICVDIILILICLGLIAILYNIIKSKFTSSSTSSSSSSTTTKLFLY